MKIPIFSLFFFFLFATAIQGFGRPVDLRKPQVVLGFSTIEGAAYYSIDLGNLKLSPTEQSWLPIHLDFSSIRSLSQDNRTEWWSLPIFESRVVFSPERNIARVILPCGKAMELRQKKVSEFASENGEWQYSGTSDLGFLKRDDGWELNFENGDLTSLTTDEGVTWIWSKLEESISISNDKTGVEVKLVKKDNADMQVYFPDGRVDVNWDSGGESGAIEFFGRHEGRRIRLSQNPGKVEILENESHKTLLQWHSGTGKITRDGINTYEHEASSLSPDVHISMTDPIGSKKSVSYSGGRLISRENRNGVREFHYVRINDGRYLPNQIVSSRANGHSTVLASAEYGKSGVLEKLRFRGPKPVVVGWVIPEIFYPENLADGFESHLHLDLNEPMHEISYQYGGDADQDHVRTEIDGETVFEIVDDRAAGKAVHRVKGKFAWLIHSVDGGEEIREFESLTNRQENLDPEIGPVFPHREHYLNERLVRVVYQDGGEESISRLDDGRISSRTITQPTGKTHTETYQYWADGTLRVAN